MFQIKLIGFSSLTNYLLRISPDVDTALTRALRRACIEVEARAIKKAPFDTGRLRNSITHAVYSKSKDVYLGVVGTNVEYAPFLEFGCKAHWAKLDTLRGWLRRHKLKVNDYALKGLWVRGRGGKGKRHFVPFSVAPSLKIWAQRHGITGQKFIKVSGKAKPFLLPALKESIPAIKAIFQSELGKVAAITI